MFGMWRDREDTSDAAAFARRLRAPLVDCIMGIVHKNITLTDKQDAWIKAQIDAGHYTSYNEYICALIRCEQERCREIETTRAALIEGEASGQPKPIDTGRFKRRMPTVDG